jgi:hypothetical protein
MCIICNTPIETLQNNNIIVVDGCEKIVTVPSLPRLRKLKISNCPNLVNFEPLRKLKELEIASCSNLERLPVFPKLETFSCYSCPKLTLSEQPSLTKMYLRLCQAIQEIPIHRLLNRLFVESCHGLQSIPTMPVLFSLTVDSCEAIETIAEQPAMNTCDLYYCDVLARLFESETLFTLRMHDCPLIETVPFYPGLVELYIKNCENIHTIASMNELATMDLNNIGVRELAGFDTLTGLKVVNLKNLERIEGQLIEMLYMSIENSPRLLSIPPPVDEYISLDIKGCPWLSVPANENYERNVSGLRKIQRQMKVAILRRRHAKFMTLKKTPLPDDICDLISRM